MARVGLRWRSCYELFPWEDWRAGRPAMLDDVVMPALDRWLAAAAPDDLPTRRERAELTFGLGHARWDPVRVLDRYELLFELALVEEARSGPAAKRRGPGLGCLWRSTTEGSLQRRSSA